MSDSVNQKPNSVGIFGIGTMGRSIAKVLLAKGYTVLAVEADPEVGQWSMDRLKADLEDRMNKGRLTKNELDSMVNRIRLATDISEILETDCVIECVGEDFELKKKVLGSFESRYAEDRIISTNTSSLSVNELADGLKHPERFVGIHFFNPPEVMPLVEIVKGSHTSEGTIVDAESFAKSLGKTPVVVPDIPGFYVNRILFPMIIEGIRVLEESGSEPSEIDNAMRLGAGMPMGPLELSDFIGNDVVLSIARQLARRTGEVGYAPPSILEKMVCERKLGRKSGRGFYKY